MTEEAIINGCRKNDVNAQRHLYEHFAPRMMGVCLRYSQSREEAEDFLQEGFIKIFQKIGQFKGEGSLEGWIKKIMVNTALDHFRRKKITESLDDERHHVPSGAHSVMEHISAKELLAVIQQLPPGYRTVFNLYAIEGYGHKEIASMLLITEGTSKSQYARARQALQEKLTTYTVE